jgi:hypothetical protein
MPGFDSNSVLTYSTLQTMVLGEGISNVPIQGSIGGASVSFNYIPYGGGHIRPPSPFLSGAYQWPIEINTNYILFGGGILGPLYYTMSVGSMSFSLFDTFGNNFFSSVFVLAGGNPSFGQQNLVQGIIPSQGAMTRVFSTQGI